MGECLTPAGWQGWAEAAGTPGVSKNGSASAGLGMLLAGKTLAMDLQTV